MEQNKDFNDTTAKLFFHSFVLFGPQANIARHLSLVLLNGGVQPGDRNLLVTLIHAESTLHGRKVDLHRLKRLGLIEGVGGGLRTIIIRVREIRSVIVLYRGPRGDLPLVNGDGDHVLGHLFVAVAAQLALVV